MKRTLPIFVFALSTTGFAGELESFLATWKANQPVRLCLHEGKDCPTTNSAQTAKVLQAIESQGTIVADELRAYEAQVQAEKEKKSEFVRGLPQEKMVVASTTKISSLAAKYSERYGANHFETQLAKVKETVSIAHAKYVAWEAEAKLVTVGRDAYITGMVSKFATVLPYVKLAFATMEDFETATRAKSELFEKVTPAVTELFNVDCRENPLPIQNATVDVIADFDYLKKLTARSNLEIECRDNTESWFSNKSDYKYDSEKNLLVLNIGSQDCGVFGSNDCYNFDGFQYAYEQMKKKRLP
jgi:hypothetical protein